MKASTLFTFVSLIISTQIFAQAGTPDLSFGNSGIDTTKTGENNVTLSNAIQKDGKILAAGYDIIRPEGSDVFRFSLIRYMPDGSLDSSFGVSGKIVNDFGSSAYGTAMVLQDDGKIIITGQVQNNFALARYNNSGELDSSFGIDGEVITDLGGNDYPNAIIIQPSDNKIVVAGTSGSYYSFVRYSANGKIDSSFATNGILITSVLSGNVPFASLGIQSNGRIIYGGSTKHSGNLDFVLIGITPDGKSDKAFGNKGKSTIDLSGSDDIINAITILPDDKIIAAGTVFANVNFGLAKFNASGTLDSSFGINGTIITNGELNEKANAVTVQSDGKILVAGLADDINTGIQFGKIIRYNGNGVIDTDFGANGIVMVSVYTGIFETSAPLYTINLQTDGKIVASGTAGSYYFLTARYNNNVLLPISLTSFSATKSQYSIILKWQTISENNNNYFAIERSNNTVSGFKQIGMIISKGNSSVMQEYNFEDKHPLNGNNFYRLKQVDKDGHFSYSQIALVNFISSANIRLYPNPVKDILNIAGLSSTDLELLTIVDQQGNIVAKKNVGQSSFSWNISSLPSGIYYLKIESDGKSTSIKFVKQ